MRYNLPRLPANNPYCNFCYMKIILPIWPAIVYAIYLKTELRYCYGFLCQLVFNDAEVLVQLFFGGEEKKNVSAKHFAIV